MSHLCSPKVTQAKNSACRRGREKSHIIHAVGVPVGFASSLRGLAGSQFALKVIHFGRDAHSLPACRAPKSHGAGNLATLVGQPHRQCSYKAVAHFWRANPDKFSIAPKAT